MTDDLKTDARNAASGNDSNFVLTFYTKGDRPVYEPLASREELDAAYGKLADSPELFDYVAAFDKGDPAWPEPWAEFGSAVKTIPVSASAPKTVTVTKTVETVKTVKTGSGWGIVAGLLAGITGLALLAKRK